MNNHQAPWQRTFEAFAGPGIYKPSDMMRVSDAEAQVLLPGLRLLPWQEPAYRGTGRHGGYSIRNTDDAWATALFHGSEMVGFYAGSSLWISQAHRGLGLSTPLIVEAACRRGGTTLPAGVVFQGYTPVGVIAHRAAHRHAVLTALAQGLPVPAAVREEAGVDPSPSPQQPLACG